MIRILGFIHEIFDYVAIFLLQMAFANGFPKLAEMASNQLWFVVKNLVRRRLISDAEALERYNGRNALEWAKFHGEKGMEEELQYYLVSAIYGILTFCGFPIMERFSLIKTSSNLFFNG
jgi:hypothetical protein